MEYTRSIGDYYEAFEGTPEEIAQLMKSIKGIYDEEEKSRRDAGSKLSVNINMEKVAEKVIGRIKEELRGSLNAVHEKVIPNEVRMDPAKFRGHEVEDYATCSCGVDGCYLFKRASERG